MARNKRHTTQQMVDTIRQGQPMNHKFLKAVADRLEKQDAFIRRILAEKHANAPALFDPS